MATKSTAIILAAGKGKRMKSDKPKVLHSVGGKELVLFATDLARDIKADKQILVVGSGADKVKSLVREKRPDCKIDFALQKEQHGTGHAVKCALEQVKIPNGPVVVLCGDTPLVEKSSVQKLIKTHNQTKAKVTVMTALLEDPTGYGRMVRDDNDNICAIVEEKDANLEQKLIPEINLAVYVFDGKFLKDNISRIKNNNKQKEFYLPDLVQIALEQNLKVSSFLANSYEGMGTNSQEQLHEVNELFYYLQMEGFIAQGVKIKGEQVFIDADIQIGTGTVIESPCYIKGQSQIGKNVTIEMGATIKSSQIKDGSYLKSHCYLDEAVVEKNCQIGPFAHLRPESVLKDNAKVGNFVETKKSVIGKGSKVNHLSYIGDATVGKNVNIGAGTITCNYDGRNKLPTTIEDNVFIGSDTQLVAPVRVKKGAFIAAGTTVTKDVDQYSLVISRTPQKIRKNWVKLKMKSKK